MMGRNISVGPRFFSNFEEGPVYFEKLEGVPDTSQSKQRSQIFWKVSRPFRQKIVIFVTNQISDQTFKFYVKNNNQCNN